jgi:hypothetical protein
MHEIEKIRICIERNSKIMLALSQYVKECSKRQIRRYCRLGLSESVKKTSIYIIEPRDIIVVCACLWRFPFLLFDRFSVRVIPVLVLIIEYWFITNFIILFFSLFIVTLLLFVSCGGR